MSSNGYIRLHRKILESWQGKHAEYGMLWVWLLLTAEYEDRPDKGLKAGQLFSSVRQIAKAVKLDKNLVHRFLIEACEEGDLLWEKGESGGTTYCTKSGTTKCASLSRFTIVKYDHYQHCDGTTPRTTPRTTLSSSSKRKKKKEKNSPSNEGPRSANSQVYDFFVRNRRIKLEIEDWEPTKQQAIIMRANIKKLLDKGAEPEEIIGWLTNYFADDRQEKDKWPWTFFMSDPIRWSSPIKTTPSRYEKDDNSNNPAYKPL